MRKILAFVLIWASLSCFALRAQNLLSNGGFENDFNQWTNVAGGGGSSANFSIESANAAEGTKAMKVEVVTPGANAWDVQSIHGTWASVLGKEYKLTFFARAAIDGTQFKAVQQVNTYASKDFSLTTAWQKYEWIFTAKEDFLQLKFHFFTAGTIYIDNVTIESTASQAQNLIVNGGFESNFTGWTNISGGGGSSANFSIETNGVIEGSKAMKVEVITPGANAWDIQSINNAWASVKGKEYKLTFFAKAAADGTQFKIVQQVNTYASKDFTLTTAWKQYEWTFIAQEDFLQMKFHFFAAGTIYIDNISIPAPVVQSPNLISNGGFENDFSQWTNIKGSGGSVANFSIETANVAEGSKAMKVEVITPGANAWDIQSINAAWASEQGKEYKLTFFAKAAVNGTQFKVVQQASTYASKDFTLTTTWQQYEWTFTAQEAFLQLKFHFFAAGTIYIDIVSIPAPTIGVDPNDELTIDTGTSFQTIQGFGGALAFYDNWVVAHPNKEELYQLLFKDLGLDWLRLRNNYRYQSPFQTEASEFVQKANTYTEDSVRILMSSWSPPASLKSNNNTNNGTLKKENGKFVYGAFANYWKDALVAYKSIGIRPSWISIQNEPDWLTDGWETCKFTPTETADYPGYDKALDSVYVKIKNLPGVPKLLGAEELGIGYNNFNNYTTPIKTKSALWGYSYHLYHGGDPSLPDSYNQSLRNISQNFGDRPNIMTEYEHYDAGWLKAAWLINNVLTEASASAYFYWDLIWPEHGLIGIDNPWDQAQWTNSKGYTVHPHFYAFKHFSKHIKPGYKRISGGNVNSVIKSSAFLSPDQHELVVVLINTSSTDITTKVAPAGWKVTASAIYQSTEGNYYQDKGSLDTTSMSIVLPGSSVTTVILKKGAVAGHTYAIFAKHSGKALSVSSCLKKNGIDIKQDHYDGAETQKWKLEDAGNGYFKLLVVHSGKSLSIAKGSVKNGAKAEQWDYVGGNYQRWKLDEVDTGFYKLTAVHSGKCLTVSHGQTKNNVTVEQQPYIGAPYQLWKFDDVTLDSADVNNLPDPPAPKVKAITAFPNPTDGSFTLKVEGFKSHDKIQVSVINFKGKVVVKGELKNESSLQVNQKLPMGIYIIQAVSNHDIVFNKLMIR